MPIHAITGFLVFSLINAFTPGPGNILALDTATNCGYRRGRPLFLGIFAGYYVVQLLCAAFVFGLGSFLPGVLGVVKYLGAAYKIRGHLRVSAENSERHRGAGERRPGSGSLSDEGGRRGRSEGSMRKKFA